MQDLSRLNEIPDPLLSGSTALSRAAVSLRDESVVPPAIAVRRPQEPGARDRHDVERRRRRTLWVCASWWLGQLLLWGIRPDLPSLSASYLLLLVALPAGVAAVCAYAALTPGRLGLGASRRLLMLLAAGSPLAFGSLALTAPPPRGPAPTSSPVDATLVCVGLLLGWMSVPLLGTTHAWRGAFAASAAWRSALAALSVGFCAAATLSLHCSNPEPWHIAIAHAAPVALVALGAALVLTRWLQS